MKTSTLSDALLSNVKNNITRRKTILTLLISALNLSISIASFVFLMVYDFGTNNEMKFYISFIMVAFLIIAVLQFLFGERQYYYLPDNTPLKAQVFYFDTTSEKLFDAIKNKNTNDLKSVYTDIDRGVKLEMAYTDNYSLAICQAYKYVPYEFVPDSDIINLSNEEVDLLLKV